MPGPTDGNTEQVGMISQLLRQQREMEKVRVTQHQQDEGLKERWEENALNGRIDLEGDQQEIERLAEARVAERSVVSGQKPADDAVFKEQLYLHGVRDRIIDSAGQGQGQPLAESYVRARPPGAPLNQAQAAAQLRAPRGRMPEPEPEPGLVLPRPHAPGRSMPNGVPIEIPSNPLADPDAHRPTPPSPWSNPSPSNASSASWATVSASSGQQSSVNTTSQSRRSASPRRSR